MLCPNCGSEFEGKFCSNCGFSTAPPKCPACGTEKGSGSFCAQCGHNFDQSTANQQQIPPYQNQQFPPNQQPPYQQQQPYQQQYQQPPYQQPVYQAPPIIINNTNTNTNVNGGGMNGISSKSKIVALLLCIFLGYWGIHRFYVGKIGTGLLYLFTGGLCGIGWLVDIIMIICGSFRDASGCFVKN